MALDIAQERRFDRLMKMTAAWRVEFLTLANLHADAKREAGVGGVFEAAELRGKPDFDWRARLAATFAIGRLWAATGSTAQALQLVDTARAEFRAAKLVLAARRLGEARARGIPTTTHRATAKLILS